MKKFLSAVIVSVFCFVNLGFAQSTAPKSIALDEASLIAYALSHVNNLGAQVYGSSTLKGDYYKFVPYLFKDADPKHMAVVIGKTRFNFTVDPADLISSYASYDGSWGNSSFTLFYGGNQFTLKKTSDGKFEIPAEGYKIKMQLSDFIPVSVPGIQNAQIEIRDDDGNYLGNYSLNENNRVWTDQGLMFLGGQLLDQKGRLIIDLKDGSQLIYNLNGGARVPLASVSTNQDLDLSIDGIRMLPDDTTNIVFAPGDQVIRVLFSKDATYTVSLPPGDYEPPLQVRAAVSSDLASDMLSGKVSDIWKGPVTGSAKAGQVLLFMFKYLPDPRPIAGGNSGKG